MEQPTPSDLSRGAGISPSYASMILTGARKPPRTLAVHIFRRTGWRHPLIAALSEAQIEALELIEPWQPRGRAGGLDGAGGDGGGIDGGVRDHHAPANTTAEAGGSTGKNGELSGGVAA